MVLYGHCRFSLTYFLISFGEAENPVFKNCFKQIDLSYGMYLWGFPVSQTLIYIFKVKYKIQFSVNMYFVLSMILVLLLAFATWHLVEKPMQKVMKKLIAKIK